MTTPTISGVTGFTGSSGPTLAITGTHMCDETPGNFHNFFNLNPNAYGFEGATPGADNYLGDITYSTAQKLTGSKSVISHSAGAVTWPSVHGHQWYVDWADWSPGLTSSPAVWTRFYARFHSVGDLWPDTDYKILALFYGGTTGAIMNFNCAAGTLTGPTMFVGTSFQSNDAWPWGSTMRQDRWICIENKWPRQGAGAPFNYQVWVDGVKVTDFNGTEGPDFGSGQIITFDINNFDTTSSYNEDWYTDNFAWSGSRLNPTSIIEIGKTSTYATATPVYQSPEALANTASSCLCDLTGLGAGPYWMWVTNNLGERSAAFSLSGGAGLTIDDSAHEWFVREAQTNPLRVSKF